jgi:hypothetical protein
MAAVPVARTKLMAIAAMSSLLEDLSSLSVMRLLFSVLSNCQFTADESALAMVV